MVIGANAAGINPKKHLCLEQQMKKHFASTDGLMEPGLKVLAGTFNPCMLRAEVPTAVTLLSPL